MIDLAKEKNLFFMEAFWSRYTPLYTHLAREILPKLGPIRLVGPSEGVCFKRVTQDEGQNSVWLY